MILYMINLILTSCFLHAQSVQGVANNATALNLNGETDLIKEVEGAVIWVIQGYWHKML